MNHIIEQWSSTHPRWQEFADVVEAEKQAQWAFNPFFEQFSRHYLVALHEDTIVGFLMFVVWEIGPHDREHPLIKINGQPLTEAKIIAFGVPNTYRRQGIGRQLQNETIVRAKQMGCYQIRSVSEEAYQSNHLLKLSMGFAVVPMERDEPALTFVMKLK